jgi:histidyl-tRNA synthetase
VNSGGGSFKSQMKRADKSGAHLALILGENEISNQQISIKNLRQDQEQEVIALTALPEFLSATLQIQN